MLEYLANYQGPHQVVLFVNQIEVKEFSAKKIVISIPESVDAALFTALLVFFKKKIHLRFKKLFNICVLLYSKKFSLTNDMYDSLNI